MHRFWNETVDWFSYNFFTLQKYRPSSGPEVTPYITVVVLITGVIGGLILVISVILFCKYCIKKRDKVFTRSVPPFCGHFLTFLCVYLIFISVKCGIIHYIHVSYLADIQDTNWMELYWFWRLSNKWYNKRRIIAYYISVQYT